MQLMRKDAKIQLAEIQKEDSNKSARLRDTRRIIAECCVLNFCNRLAFYRLASLYGNVL